MKLVIVESPAKARTIGRYLGPEYDVAASALATISDLEHQLGILEDQLRTFDYAVSDDFTLADIVIGHILFRWFDIDIERKSRPLVEAYYDRLKTRPAYQNHVMISYDVLWVEGA